MALVVTISATYGAAGSVIGPAVAERILESGYDGPVLFLSGYSEEAVTHEGRLRPRAHFLGKPFTPDTLAEAVRHALEGRRRVSD